MIKGVSYRDNPLERRIMETFYINVPKANGTKKIDKVEEFIKLLQYGKENAIKRNYFAPLDDQKQKFDAIVMITDRDEITTETEFIEKISD